MEPVTESIEIEIAFALPHRQFLERFSVAAGTTIEQAIIQSGISNTFPEIDLTKQKFGIFSKLVRPGTVLQNGDRVEIYRPLLLDPKEKRRKRLADKKKK